MNVCWVTISITIMKDCLHKFTYVTQLYEYSVRPIRFQYNIHCISNIVLFPSEHLIIVYLTIFETVRRENGLMLYLYLWNIEYLKYLRIGNVSENLQLLDYYLVYIMLEFYITLIILYVIDCTHSSEHDNDN